MEAILKLCSPLTRPSCSHLENPIPEFTLRLQNSLTTKNGFFNWLISLPMKNNAITFFPVLISSRFEGSVFDHVVIRRTS